jgi:hypothetical protein
MVMANTLPPNPQDTTEGKIPESAKSPGFFMELFRGGVFNNKMITRNIWFIVLWFFFALGYIYNRFQAEEWTRERVRVEREVKNLRSEWLSLQTDLLNMTRQSSLMEKISVENSALRPAMEPPHKIELKPEKP